MNAKSINFLLHHSKDNVAVVVTEDVVKGMTLNGKDMESEESLNLQAEDDIPLGHKIALVDLNKGDTIIKYGEDMGVITADAIKQGCHVHVHNAKTKRW